MPKIKTYEGSHGTSIKNVIEIKKSGFRIGTGRVGRGIYFWAKWELYIELAYYWWNGGRSGNCSKRIENNCAIILATIQVPQDEVINLETLEVKDSLAKICIKLGIKEWNYVMQEKVFSLLITDMEDDLNTQLNMLIVRVPPPKSYKKDYLIGILGAPICYVVRNSKYIIINRIINRKGVEIL